MSNTLVINKKEYPIRILFLPKKNSSASLRDGEVVLRISKYLSKKLKQEHIASLTRLMKKRLGEQAEALSPWDFPLTDGHTLSALGTKFMLHIKKNEKHSKPRVVIKNQAIKIILPDKKLSKEEKKNVLKRIRRKLSKHFELDFNRYVRMLNNDTVRSHRLKNIRLKEQMVRWGSCTPEGNINISSRLMFMPDELLEYVCVHELTHLEHLNHSKKFWQLVLRYLPDYKKRKKELSKYI